MRGRCAVSSGQGPGLSQYDLGEVTGTENITLNQGQIPIHTHTVAAVDDDATVAIPTGALPANLSAKGYSKANPNTQMSPLMIGGGGGNQPHPNIQPLLCLNYCIALEGIFPSRN